MCTVVAVAGILRPGAGSWYFAACLPMVSIEIVLAGASLLSAMKLVWAFLRKRIFVYF